MANVRLKRGSAAVVATYVGAPGELVLDTTNQSLRVHDGTTSGGIVLARTGSNGKVSPSVLPRGTVPEATVITSPTNAATSVDFTNGTLNTGAFSILGFTDTHSKTQWQIATDSAFASVVYDSGDSNNLTSLPLSVASLSPTTTYYWRARHKGTNTGYGPFSAVRSFTTGAARGEAVFTTPGTHNWTVPAGVTSVCVVAVGAGGSGGSSTYTNASGGGGGGLGYKNNVTVTPGSTFSVVVGAGTTSASGGSSSFGAVLTATGGSYSNSTSGGVGGTKTGADGGGNGGNGGNDSGQGHGGGGGGAAGYSGNGGHGGNVLSTAETAGSGGGGSGGGGYGVRGGSGGGVGLYGQGSNGTTGVGVGGGYGGMGGSGGTNGEGITISSNVAGYYGGGSGGRGINGTGTVSAGGRGAVRIIWGAGRSFPSNAA